MADRHPHGQTNSICSLLNTQRRVFEGATAGEQSDEITVGTNYNTCSVMFADSATTSKRKRNVIYHADVKKIIMMTR